MYNNGNEYITSISTNGNKDWLWNKINFPIKTRNNKSKDCNDKHIRIKLDSEDNFSLRKTLKMKMYDVVIVVRSSHPWPKRLHTYLTTPNP